MVDSSRLADLVRLYGDHRKAGRHHEVERAAEVGLDLLRGPAFMELEDWDRSTPERSRIRELVLLLEEWHLEAQLLRGEARAEPVAEAERLVSGAPLREQRWSVLMKALIAAGRPAEALRAYERASRTLVDHLGARPSTEMQDEYRVALELTALPPALVQPSYVPHPVNPFGGREAELAELTNRLSHARLVTIVGPSGVGKTRLAVETARRHQARVQYAAWFVDLDQVQTSEGLVSLVNEIVLGSPTEGSPLAISRALGAEPALLVLDNAEHLAEEVAVIVRSWLESVPELRVLVTSRHRLPAAHADIMTLGPLNDADAAWLFVDRVRRHGPAPVVVDTEVTTAICHAVDNLPLGIELAAARADLVTPLEIRRQLTSTDAQTRLLTAPSSGRSTLQDAIDLSYGLLATHPRGLLHRLTILDGDFGVETASGLWDLDLGATEEALRALLDRSLLHVADSEHRRFRLLRVIRTRVIEQPKAEHDRAKGEDALLRWWDQQSQAFWNSVQDNHHADAIALLNQEQASLHLAIRLASAHDPRLAVQLMDRTDDWWRATNRTLAAWQLMTQLIQDERLAEEPNLLAKAIGTALVHGTQTLDVDDAEVHSLADRLTDLVPLLDDALEAEVREAMVRFNNDDTETGRRLERLLVQARSSGPQWVATILDFLARWYLTNDPHRALETAHECLRATEPSANLVSTAHAQETLAGAHLVNNEPATATTWLRRATASLVLADHSGCLLHCYETVAWLAVEQGRNEQATALLSAVASMREEGRRRRLPVEWTSYQMATAAIGAPDADHCSNARVVAARLTGEILSRD